MPHNKSIKVWETGSPGKNSMPVGKACQAEDALSIDNHNLLRLSQGALSKHFSIVKNSGSNTDLLILMPSR